MEGGERCAFSSWKYSHYFELKNPHKCLIKPVRPGPRIGAGNIDLARPAVRCKLTTLAFHAS